MAFIPLICAVVTFGIWLYKRHAAAVDDPKVQNQKRYEQIDRDIAAGDSNAATVHASADLDELERLQNAGAHR